MDNHHRDDDCPKTHFCGTSSSSGLVDKPLERDRSPGRDSHELFSNITGRILFGGALPQEQDASSSFCSGAMVHDLVLFSPRKTVGVVIKARKLNWNFNRHKRQLQKPICFIASNSSSSSSQG